MAETTTSTPTTSSDTGHAGAGAAPAAIDPRPRLVRIVAFVAERFLPVPQLVLLSLLWAAGLTWAVAAVRANGTTTAMLPAHPHWADLALGYVGTMLFFFHLRVFDDVKDADHDRVHETDRPIPRGLVSEREVDVLSVVVIGVEIAIFATIGTLTLAAWAAATAFTVLMRVEFFVGAWLERNILTYAISHMLSMCLVFAMLVALGIEALVTAGSGAATITDAAGTHAATAGDVLGDGTLWIAYVASFCLGMGFELGRKFERYYTAHGRLAYQLWMAFPVLGALVFAWQAQHLLDRWAYVATMLVALMTLATARITYQRRPQPDPPADALDPALRTRIELTPALAGLLCYAILAVAGAMEVAW